MSTARRLLCVNMEARTAVIDNREVVYVEFPYLGVGPDITVRDLEPSCRPPKNNLDWERNTFSYLMYLRNPKSFFLMDGSSVSQVQNSTKNLVMIPMGRGLADLDDRSKSLAFDDWNWRPDYMQLLLRSLGENLPLFTSTETFRRMVIHAKSTDAEYESRCRENDDSRDIDCPCQAFYENEMMPIPCPLCLGSELFPRSAKFLRHFRLCGPSNSRRGSLFRSVVEEGLSATDENAFRNYQRRVDAYACRSYFP